ncbi:MAG: gamma-glutamylcyclotransferase [Patescibacteria group bacterium]|nr:gamma-glutamylcyclotransferase [Patescibacteria group bacterium]
MFEQTNGQQNVPRLNLEQNNNSSILNKSPQLYPIDEKQQTKPKKKRIFFVILFIFLLLIAGGFFWYLRAGAMYFVYKMSFPWGDNIKNYSAESKSRIIVPSDLLIQIKSSLVDSGLITQEQIDKIESIDSEFNIKIIDKDLEVHISSKLGNTEILQYILKYFYKDAIYIKADLSKILPSIPMSDKWIYLEMNQEGKFLEDSFIPTDQINKYISKFSTENIKNIKEIELVKYINILDPHESKEYNGEKLKKISVTVKEGKSSDLVFHIMKKILSKEEYNNLYKKYQDSKNRNDEDFKRSLELINSLENNINISFWINKKTKIVREIDYSIKDFDIGKIFYTYNSNKKNQNINIDANLIFNEIEDYKIEKPIDTMNIEEIFGSLLNTSIEPILESKTLVLPNILQDLDEDGLLDIYESFYNSDPRDPDTDRDSYLDGNEVLYAYNPNAKDSGDKLNDNKNIFYFAYGSNMDLDRMILRCGERNFVGFSNSYLNDFKFYFYNRGYANIKPQQSSIVYGVLYKINKNCFDALDKAEGYPNLYQRQIVKIINPMGIFDAHVYIVKNDNSIGVPSKSYFDTVIKGASQYALPKNYISEINNLYNNRQTQADQQ